MKRVVLTTTSTVAGLVLLLGWKQAAGHTPALTMGGGPAPLATLAPVTPSLPTTRQTTPAAIGTTSAPSPSSKTSAHPSPSASTAKAKPGSTASASPTPGTTPPPQTPTQRPSTPSQPPATHAPTPTPSKTTPTHVPSPSPTARVFTGGVAQTPYGPVQVQITVLGRHVLHATAIQQPSGTSRSNEINSYAIPQLNQEAVAADGGNVSAVSGASYTSAGYQQSLQSALDAAGI